MCVLQLYSTSLFQTDSITEIYLDKYFGFWKISTLSLIANSTTQINVDKHPRLE